MGFYWFPILFSFFILSLSALSFGMSLFALSQPLMFCEWFSPYALLRQSVLSGASRRFDYTVAYIFGLSFFVLLIASSFVIGGFLFTWLFDLKEVSPFSIFFYGL